MRWFAALLVMLLSGCSSLFGTASIEQQIQEQMRSDPTQKVIDGPRIFLIRDTNLGRAAVYGYEIERESGERVRMTETSFFEREGFAWSFTGGGSSARPADAAIEPIEFGSAGSFDSADPEYMYVSGLIGDQHVTHVAVTFSDGTQAVAPVDRGAYLLDKRGDASVLQIEALDADGNVIHQQVGR